MRYIELMRYNKNNYSTFLKNMLSLDIAPSTPTTFPSLFNKARPGKFQKNLQIGGWNILA